MFEQLYTNVIIFDTMYDYRTLITLFREWENYDAIVRWIENNSDPSEIKEVNAHENGLWKKSLADYYISEAAKFCFNCVYEEDSAEYITISSLAIKNTKTQAGYRYAPLKTPVFLGVLAQMCILAQGIGTEVADKILTYLRKEWPNAFKSYTNAIHRAERIISLTSQLEQTQGSVAVIWENKNGDLRLENYTNAVNDSLLDLIMTDTQKEDLHRAILRAVVDGNAEEIDIALFDYGSDLLAVLKRCVQHCDINSADILTDNSDEAKFTLSIIRVFRKLQNLYDFPRIVRAGLEISSYTDLRDFYDKTMIMRDNELLHRAPTLWKEDGSQVHFIVQAVYVYGLLPKIRGQVKDLEKLKRYENFLAGFDHLYNTSVKNGNSSLRIISKDEICTTRDAMSLRCGIVENYLYAMELRDRALDSKLYPKVKAILSDLGDGDNNKVHKYAEEDIDGTKDDNQREFPYFAKGISQEGMDEVFRVLDSLSNATKAEVGAAIQKLMDDGLIDFNYESNKKIYPALQPFIKLKESTFLTISLKKLKYVKNN